MKAACVFLVALLACAAVASARQDEALDSLLLADVQPVADPVPRLLAEALEPAPGSYGGETPSPDTTTTTKPIPTTTIPSSPSPSASGAAAAAGAASLFAAAAVAVAML